MTATRLRRPLLLVGTAALAIACALVLRSGAEPRAVADRAALLKQLTAHPIGTTVRPYQRLVETLPNAKSQDGSVIHDSVVVGSVVAVSPGNGFDETGQAPMAGKPSARVVRFDDAHADWRTLRVTVRVDQVLAGPSTRQLVVDWSVLGSSAHGEDAAAIGRALKDLGTVAVFTLATPGGAENLGLRRQVPDRQYGLAVVAKDGSLSFPFIDPVDGSVDARSFMAGVDTLGELRTAATKPAWTRSG